MHGVKIEVYQSRSGLIQSGDLERVGERAKKGVTPFNIRHNIDRFVWLRVVASLTSNGHLLEKEDLS